MIGLKGEKEMERRKMRLFVGLLAAVLLLALTACASSVPAISEPASPDAGEDETTDWQAQYDLGVRYLSEGNYEEAIIAFTAAIEIESMHAESYLGRAQAYDNLDDSNAIADYLEAISLDEEMLEAYKGLLSLYKRRGMDEAYCNLLRKAFDATGDESFYETNQYDLPIFELRDTYVIFEELEEETQDAIRGVIREADAGDVDAVIAAYEMLPQKLKEKAFYTRVDGYKICLFSYQAHVSALVGEYDTTNVTLEMRPQNGTGYYYAIGRGGYSHRYYQRTECACVAWQWNGTLLSSCISDEESTCHPSEGKINHVIHRERTINGMIKDNLCEGHFESQEVQAKSADAYHDRWESVSYCSREFSGGNSESYTDTGSSGESETVSGEQGLLIYSSIKIGSLRTFSMYTLDEAGDMWKKYTW